MRSGRRGTLAALGVAGLILSGCAEAAEETATSGHQPATVEQVAGSDLSRITLEPRAVERLGLRTEPVREAGVETPDGGEQRRLTVPYGAVVYDTGGATWVYTSPESRSYQRAPVTVDFVDGDVAVLTDGPPPGTAVVSVAAAELYGAELGVDH